MLHIANSIAEVLLPIAYVLTAYMYAVSFFSDDSFSRRYRSYALVATTVLHFFYVGFHTSEYGRCMVTTPFEIMSLIAFTLILTYTIIEFRSGEKGAGFFIITLAMLFELTSAVVLKFTDAYDANPVLSHMGIGIHVTLAVFGYAGFALSAMHGVMYLLMYRELKRGSFGSAYRNLPSLEALESMSVLASLVGFVFLTASMIVGVIWLPRMFTDFSWFDPKLLSTALVWLLYLGMITARYGMRVGGRRIVLLSIGGFAAVVLSLTVVNVFLSDFHRFL